MAPLATPPAAALARRELFPRGLVQPVGGFRFGADTLLLSAFAARSLPLPRPTFAGPENVGVDAPRPLAARLEAARPRPAKRIAGLDLGTGCGAASLGLLLLRPDLDLGLTGIDSGPEMVAAATENALALGYGERFRAELADVQGFRRPGFELALANPPFRRPGTGRACPDEARDRARVEGPGGFAAFAACAARCLRPRGRLFVVHLAERLPELLRILADQGLAPRRALPVQGSPGKAPKLVLLECLRHGQAGRPGPGEADEAGVGNGAAGGLRKGPCTGPHRAQPGFVLLAPLVLCAADGSLTPEAAAFCPLLAANPRRAGPGAGSTLAKREDAG